MAAGLRSRHHERLCGLPKDIPWPQATFSLSSFSVRKNDGLGKHVLVFALWPGAGCALGSAGPAFQEHEVSWETLPFKPRFLSPRKLQSSMKNHISSPPRKKRKEKGRGLSLDIMNLSEFQRGMVEVFCPECWQRCLTVWKASGREEERQKKMEGNKQEEEKKTQQLSSMVPEATVNALHPLTHLLLTASLRWYHGPRQPQRGSGKWRNGFSNQLWLGGLLATRFLLLFSR